MFLKSLREKWRQRRFDLAMGQLGNPADRPDDDGMVNPTPMGIRSGRAEMGSISRMSRAKSKTEWRGD